MCGIATISIGRNARKLVPYPRLRALIRELLLELEVRGKDASGIAVINENVDSVVYKKPLRPSRLVVRPMFEEVLERVDENTNFVLLHARATTVGTNAKVFNNHPIIIPGYVGIHNGTLNNDISLFKRYEKDFAQLGTVDSEIIFQLYKYYISAGLESENAMKNTAAELRGAFTGAVVDLNSPNRLVMFKHERPLSIITVPHFDLVIAVSEPNFFKSATERLKIQAKVKSCEYLHDGTGIIIDVNSETRIVKNIHDFSLPTPTSNVSRHASKPWLGSVK